MAQVNKINAAEFATLNMALTGVDASKKYVVYNGFTYNAVEYKHEKNLSTKNLTELAKSAFEFVEDTENGTPSAVKHNYRQLEQSVSSLVNRLEANRLESRKSFFYRILEFFGFVNNDQKILKDIIQKTKERLNILETETTDDTNPTTPQVRREILFDNWKQMSDFNRENFTLNKELKQLEKKLMNDTDFLAMLGKMLGKIMKDNNGIIPTDLHGILDPICDNLDKVLQYNSKFGGFDEFLKKIEKRIPLDIASDFSAMLSKFVNDNNAKIPKVLQNISDSICDNLDKIRKNSAESGVFADSICDNLVKIRKYSTETGFFAEFLAELLNELDKRILWDMASDFRTKLELSEKGQTFQAIVPTANGVNVFDFTNTGSQTFQITYSKADNAATLLDVVTPLLHYVSGDTTKTLNTFNNVKLDEKIGYAWFRDLFAHHSPGRDQLRLPIL